MFINESIVAILFRLINFVALIAVAVFIYRKYIKCDLLCMIAEQKASHEHLYEQQLSFEQQQVALDTLLKEEAVLCKNFRIKIDEWKKAITLEHEMTQKAHAQELVAAQERAATIAANREQEKMRTRVTQEVAANLQRNLSHYFKDTPKNSDYLDAIVRFMDERA
jgi:hypothetical protein